MRRTIRGVLFLLAGLCVSLSLSGCGLIANELFKKIKL